MSDSVRRPHRRQPNRLLHPWDSPGKNTGVGCHFLLQCRKVKSESEVAQSCPTLCDPTDCSLPGSSVRGIFQARVLEWVAIAFSLLCFISFIKLQLFVHLFFPFHYIFNHLKARTVSSLSFVFVTESSTMPYIKNLVSDGKVTENVCQGLDSKFIII